MQIKLLKIKYWASGLAVLLLTTLNGCKKLITVNPPTTELVSSVVYTDSATVETALVGLYANMAFSPPTAYQYGISTLCGFSADELQYVGSTYNQFIDNGIPVTDGNVESVWSFSYSVIYAANSVIYGVQNGSGMSDSFSNQAIAQAKFVRAFCYFYLTNLYGAVPLALTTDVAQNSVLGQSSSAAVYQQIISDLLFVQSKLATDYSASAGQRTMANQSAATALLARVYLYTGDWADAGAQATAVIGNSALYSLSTNLATVFTPSNSEAILQFNNSSTGYTTFAQNVLPNTVAGVPTYILTSQLVNAYEAGDNRRAAWLDSLTYNGTEYYYPYKYKSLVFGANAEYYTLLRLAEQYLIRAEAEAEQGNISGAQADINVIRNRAGLGNTTAGDQASLLAAVAQERRIELNCEWGHRWLDLKRTGTANAVLGGEKTTWTATDVLWPIPSSEILSNSKLVQNAGY
jgi:hypothetical protein